MRKVEKAIAQENASVRSGGPYKTIVLLDPFTYSPARPSPSPG